MIYYSTQILSSFAKKDIAILERIAMSDDILRDSKGRGIIVFKWKHNPKWVQLWEFVRHLVSVLRHIRRTDVFICQAAGYSAFFPVLIGRLTGIPAIIIAAGTESAGLKHIGYGDFIHPVVKHFTRFAIRNCSMVLPVSKKLVFNNYLFDDQEPNKIQGYQHFIRAEPRFMEVQYGFDTEFWTDDLPGKQGNVLLTVAYGCENKGVFYRKGLDIIYRLAKENPEYIFHIVGNKAPVVPPSENIKYFGVVDRDQIKRMYQEATYYMQLSRFEGMPNALCEAMLCGCIPIVSDVTSMPEVAGDTGLVLRHTDSDVSIPEATPERCRAARNRVLPLKVERREEGFRAAIREVMGRS